LALALATGPVFALLALLGGSIAAIALTVVATAWPGCTVLIAWLVTIAIAIAPGMLVASPGILGLGVVTPVAVVAAAMPAISASTLALPSLPVGSIALLRSSSVIAGLYRLSILGGIVCGCGRAIGRRPAIASFSALPAVLMSSASRLA
jgi:hypothetical protein